MDPALKAGSFGNADDERHTMWDLLALFFYSLDLLHAWRFWVPLVIAAIFLSCLHQLAPHSEGIVLVAIPVVIGAIVVGAVWQFKSRSH